MTGTLLEDLWTFMIVSRLVFLRMRNVADKCCRENRNTHFVFNIFFYFSPENRSVYDIPRSLGKYCGSGQATDGNMAHAHCMLDTKGYKCTPPPHTHTHTHTHRLCNTHCFSTVTTVTRTYLNDIRTVPVLLKIFVNPRVGEMLSSWSIVIWTGQHEAS
jgi:hypothetical protein